ncbi:hypothetical protein ACFLTP_09445 [Chloroflexota bacterium]
MRDKGLNIFLSILFGVGGIAILLLSWMLQVSQPERILNTAIGSVGLIWVLTKTLPLIPMLRNVGHRKHLQDVEN